MTPQELFDYVRAMAYGPSQGEYYHDAMYGPLGALQPGDVALSPDLQKKYPLGSNIFITPKDGDPFIGRVADHSYYSPGNPTSNTIEMWNGQDLGHVRISKAPEWASGITSMFGKQSYEPSLESAQAMSESQLAAPTQWSNVAATPGGGNWKAGGMAIAGALSDFGKQIAQQGSQAQNAALQQMQKPSAGAQYLKQLLLGEQIPDYETYFNE